MLLADTEHGAALWPIVMWHMPAIGNALQKLEGRKAFPDLYNTGFVASVVIKARITDSPIFA